MISNLYCIYDVKAEAYLLPFFVQNENILRRMITDTLNDPNHQFTKHPEDYIVYELGSFSDREGKLEAKTATVLFKLIDFKAKAEEK
jgi:hypothetical protein